MSKKSAMPRITIARYNTTGGTATAPPVGKFYAGYLEPEDKRWILYIGVDGTPQFFGKRDADGGVIEGPITGMVNGHQLVCQHGIGDLVHVVFDHRGIKNDSAELDAGQEAVPPGSYLVGNVAAVTFTDYGKVLYDVKVPVCDSEGKDCGESLIGRIDSCFVLPPPPTGGPIGIPDPPQAPV